jgi:sulfite exporter TauE/SafE
MTGWVSVLAASALGSLHCVGMCGGLVGFYATGQTGAAPRWAPHAAYHLARLLAYTALGAAAGQLGASLDALGASAGAGQLGLVVAVSTLALCGALALGGRQRLAQLARSRPEGGLLRRLERTLGALTYRLRERPPIWRASALGLSSALLPCGWLYAFVALAAATGSAGGGALLLLAFWSGTVPALLGLGIGLQRVAAPLRARVPRLGAALITLACVVNVASRWPAALSTDASGAAPPAPSCHHAH